MDLANSLLNDTIFEIIKGLLELQNVTEKYLFQEREKAENDYELEIRYISDVVLIELNYLITKKIF